MTIKLSFKIFVTFLSTSIMVVALMVAIMQFYVSRNFADYVNRAALERLGDLMDALAAEYQMHQGWQPLKNNTDRWEEILRSSLPRRDIDENRHLPPSPDLEDNPPAGAQKTPSTKRHGALHGLARSLALFDADQQHIVGGRSSISSDSYTLQEIRVNGRTAGWLGLHKRERLSNPMVVGFLKQQSQAFYLIGCAILLLAAVVSFFLSRHFLAPIRQLTAGTRALTSRQFNTRIEVQSKDEIGQLAADFNVMARTFEKYEHMQKQWISDISHELRTPLAILRGEIEALQDGVRAVDSKALASLQSEVVHLNKLVDDLHLLALADARGLNIKNEPLKPLQILREALGLFRTRLEGRQISVELELDGTEDMVLAGDADQLTRLFLNIMENTVRYTDSPGMLKIIGRCADSKLTVCFEDSAPGVPEEALEHLFDRLYRVDKSRSRELGGSGLGLSICKQIVESHGGSIRAAHGSLGGLKIIVELPVR